jgi:hypothetical protein
MTFDQRMRKLATEALIHMDTAIMMDQAEEVAKWQWFVIHIADLIKEYEMERDDGSY